MRIVKITIIVMMIMTGSITVAQHTKSKDVLKTTTQRTFMFEKDGKKIPYQIKVLETRDYNYKFEKKDEGKINQDRVVTPAYVTKLIYINNDLDKRYDRYIVLRYKRDATDSFRLVPTKRGFGVNVDNKKVEYIMGEGFYFVNNEDKDFFIVEEFDSI